MSKHAHLHDHEVILDVKNLRVAYGKVEALHEVNLTIRRGEIVTVIGPNGAGKTTLLASLMGLLPADGEIVYMGHAQGREREVETLVRQGMTLVPEKRELFAEMSVEDNLLLGAFDRYRTGHRDQMETMDEVFELFPRLEERRAQLAGTLRCSAMGCEPDATDAPQSEATQPRRPTPTAASASATREVSMVIQRRPHCSATVAVVPEPQVGSSTRSPGSVAMRRQRSMMPGLV